MESYFDPRFGDFCFSSTVSSFLVLLEILTDGPVLPTKPHSEEREARTNEAVVGGSQGSHFDPVGFLLFWVSFVVGYAFIKQSHLKLSQVVGVDLRRDRLFQCLPYRRPLAKPIQPQHT